MIDNRGSGAAVVVGFAVPRNRSLKVTASAEALKGSLISIEVIPPDAVNPKNRGVKEVLVGDCVVVVPSESVTVMVPGFAYSMNPTAVSLLGNSISRSFTGVVAVPWLSAATTFTGAPLNMPGANRKNKLS